VMFAYATLCHWNCTAAVQLIYASLPEGVEGNVRSDLEFLNNFSPCGANSTGRPHRAVTEEMKSQQVQGSAKTKS